MAVAVTARVRVRCPAKINLGLWILGRRPDGYHEIDTVLQSIALEDELVLEAGGSGLEIQARGLPIPGEGPNIIERAWEELRRARGEPPQGVHVRLLKRIPAGSGLGGGSADAAGFLAGVDRLFGLGISDPELRQIAARVGSDVPFFLRGGLARGTGRGDHLRHLGPMEPYWVVLATPPFGIPTSWAYEQARNRLTQFCNKASILVSAIAQGDLKGMAGAMRNAFEGILLPQFPHLGETKRMLLSGGALGAVLTGSGSTVFGVASSREHAQAVAGAAASCRAEIRVIRTLDRGANVVPSPD